MTRCEECGQPVTTKMGGRWRQVRGWEQVGHTDVVLRQATGKVMHKLCMELRRAKAGEQLSLFGDDA